MEKYHLCKVAEDGHRIEFKELVCRDDGHAVHLAKQLFKITMSKSGTVIGMCSCWNAKDEHPAARCAADRDRCRHRLGNDWQI
jgi:hypothetical protein